MMPSNYPLAVDPARVGEYPAEAKSGGGYFYDEVLEYRVWCRPWLGAPDEFNGDVYYYAFDSFEAAKVFADETQGAEQPLVLVRQYEWIDEPTPGHLLPMKGERITEWAVEWLQGSKRAEQSVFLKACQQSAFSHSHSGQMLRSAKSLTTKHSVQRVKQTRTCSLMFFLHFTLGKSVLLTAILQGRNKVLCCLN